MRSSAASAPFSLETSRTDADFRGHRRLMKLHFDLTGVPEPYLAEWEQVVERLASTPHPNCKISSSASDSDQVILPRESREPYRARPLCRRDIDTFVWETSDLPPGRMSGFYCSLNRHLFDHGRHRTFCYPFIINERIEPFDLSDAHYDYSFVGSLTWPLRKEILDQMATVSALQGILSIYPPIWDFIFDRSGVKEKIEYANAVRRSRFVLCPRGFGVGSIRLFETMKARRVPIIISDDYVLPTGIEWSSCAVVVRERDIAKIPILIRNASDNWAILASNARCVWERCFSDRGIIDQFYRTIPEVQEQGKLSLTRQLKFMRAQAQDAAGRRLERLRRRLTESGGA